MPLPISAAARTMAQAYASFLINASIPVTKRPMSAQEICRLEKGIVISERKFNDDQILYLVLCFRLAIKNPHGAGFWFAIMTSIS